MSGTRVLGLSRSARKNGNRAGAITAALDFLKGKSIETKLVHLTDHNIQPCRKCNMECYHNASCPTPDDSKELAALLEEFDGIIVGSPLYNGTVPAMMSAFLERSPYPYDDVLMGKVTAAIVIGSLGEAFAAMILTSWLAPMKRFVGWIELDPRATAALDADLKDSWLRGNIMESKPNQEKVIALAYRFCNELLHPK